MTDTNDDNKDDSGPRRRQPPTIDLTAASVFDRDTADADAAKAGPSEAKPRATWRDRLGAARSSMKFSVPWPTFARSTSPKRPPRRIIPMLGAALAGALATLVALVGIWLAGGTDVSNRIVARMPQSTGKTDMQTPGPRTAKSESRPSSAGGGSATAMSARIEALEKSVAGLRDDIASTRTAVDDIKAASSVNAPASSVTAIDERVSKIERATIALTGQIPSPQASGADDARLRRAAAATLLDSAVRQGEPYAVALTAAKSATDDASGLKPLDEFAAKGIPPANMLTRELLTLLPQLVPKPAASSSSGLLDRLQQSAAKLVRVQRIDNASSDTPTIVAKATVAAQRDDLTAARRELNALSATDRAPLASWIDKVDAREAALAASRQFAADTMSALPKPAQ